MWLEHLQWSVPKANEVANAEMDESNALIDMYGKFSATQFAYFYFCNMYDESLISWGTLIAGISALNDLIQL